jgi:Terminase large subunit, T4likevirus-type, N-terminal
VDRAEGYFRREVEYPGLPSQDRFLKSKARFKGFSGPIGSGKSYALVWQAIHSAYENRGRTGLIGAPTYPMLRDATASALIEILDRDEIPYEMNRSENFIVLREVQSRILLRAVEDFDRLRGSNLAWFGVDELTYAPEGAWLRLEGRLRDPSAVELCGFAVWTPKGFDWVYERFIANPVEGYETIRARPYENRFLLDRVPDYYERLKRSYESRFYEQEVLGDYLSIAAGRVYSEFSREANLRDVVVEDKEALLWALDFNVDPMCSVVAQVTASGEIHVLDEIVLGRATTEQACQEFTARYRGHRGGVRVYADATGARLQTTGKSDLEILRSFFRAEEWTRVRFEIPSSNPAVRERVMLVNGKLRNASGESRLFVHPRCAELIKDFEQVAFIEGSQAIDKEKDGKRTHLSDALGYLVWQECRAKEKVGERGHRLL